MKDAKQHFEDTMRILNAEGQDLKALARLTKFPVFAFYHQADLIGIDLSNQDLRGLSFKKADLRQANLDDIIYDSGAFNDSELDDRYDNLKDSFDFSMNELLSYMTYRYAEHFYVRFRPGDLDSIIDGLGLYISQFADLSNINLDTLRKARRGATVAKETARAIAEAIDIDLSDTLPKSSEVLFSDSSDDWLSHTAMIRQQNWQNRAILMLVKSLPDGGFKDFTRQDVIRNHLLHESVFGETPEFSLR